MESIVFVEFVALGVVFTIVVWGLLWSAGFALEKFCSAVANTFRSKTKNNKAEATK